MRGILCPVSAASVEYRRYTMKLIRSLILLAMALLLCGSAFAEQPQASAHKAQTPIIIDGVLDEWVLDSPMILNSEEQLIRDAQTWHGKEDLSCVTYVMWDEENLYLAVDVTEDSPFGAIEMLPLDGEDNFKVLFSTDPTADPARTTYGTCDWMLYLIVDNVYWDTAIERSMIPVETRGRYVSKGMTGGEDVLNGYEKAVTTNASGFIFEARIPWENFSNKQIPVYVPQAGDCINFDFVITDIGYPCPGTDYIPQMAWTGDISINYNPSGWGRLLFVD